MSDEVRDAFDEFDRSWAERTASSNGGRYAARSSWW
jgi:hypothetical protein